MTLHSLILDYSNSLTRIEAEREFQKELTVTAQAMHKIDPKAFKAAAMAYHKDKIPETIEELESQLGVLSTIQDKPEGERERTDDD